MLPDAVSVNVGAVEISAVHQSSSPPNFVSSITIAQAF
jgi:hypothetical protein